MMIKLALSAGLVATLASVHAGSSVKEWQGKYDSFGKLIRDQNMTAFAEYFAPTFVNVDSKGMRQNRTEFLKMIQGMFAGVDKVGCKIKVLGVHKAGNLMHVDFDLRVTLHRANATTKVHEAGRDTWTTIGGQWRMVKTVDRSFSIR